MRFICAYDIEAEIKGSSILCYDLLTIEGTLRSPDVFSRLIKQDHLTDNPFNLKLI